jgi:hypothetical protein
LFGPREYIKIIPKSHIFTPIEPNVIKIIFQGQNTSIKHL